MSADYWLERGGERLDMFQDSWNVTYNLGPMLREAGFPAWQALTGAPASEVGGMLKSVSDKLKADPRRFDEMNAANGWGTREWAIEFLDAFAEGCAAAPDAIVGSWL